MRKIITLLLLALTFGIQGWSEDYSSEYSRIGQMITKKEWASFVPVVESEGVYTVNKVSPRIFDKPITANNNDERFSIKGCIFQHIPSFPVNLGDQLQVSNEVREELPGNAYRVHMTLTSLVNGKSQNFISRVIYTGNSGKIKKVVENSRKSGIHNICEKMYYDSDGDGYCEKSEPYVFFENSYDITLEDGSTYNIYINHSYPVADNGEEKARKLSEEAWVQAGDEIHFKMDVEKQHDGSRGILEKVKISGRFRNEELWASGPKRYPERYCPDNVYLVSSSVHTRFVNIERFCSLDLTGSRGHYYDTFYEPGKAPAHYSGWVYKKTPMKLLGYYYHDNKRIFVFLQQNGDLLFTIPKLMNK